MHPPWLVDLVELIPDVRARVACRRSRLRVARRGDDGVAPAAQDPPRRGRRSAGTIPARGWTTIESDRTDTETKSLVEVRHSHERLGTIRSHRPCTPLGAGAGKQFLLTLSNAK
jgi:hypothetical protein